MFFRAAFEVPELFEQEAIVRAKPRTSVFLMVCDFMMELQTELRPVTYSLDYEMSQSRLA
jgi:hypothetical protein